jgi:hypothetical protein
MTLPHKLLMVAVLARVAGPQLAQHGELIPFIHAPRLPLRMVHADHHRLAAGAAVVDDAHGSLL